MLVPSEERGTGEGMLVGWNAACSSIRIGLWGSQKGQSFHLFLTELVSNALIITGDSCLYFSPFIDLIAIPPRPSDSRLLPNSFVLLSSLYFFLFHLVRIRGWGIAACHTLEWAILSLSFLWCVYQDVDSQPVEKPSNLSMIDLISLT